MIDLSHLAKHIGALILAALLVATSGVSAVARHADSEAVGVMVLCTGKGTSRVLMNADGAPVEQTHICPDCVTVAFAEHQGAVFPTVHDETHHLIFTLVELELDVVSTLTKLQARGPPKTLFKPN